ncbi:MAG TPA: orotidine-5'-phosphate decarboxylase [Chloroflexota bacterium]
MTFAERLAALCRERRSHVCVGLDPLPDRLPAAVRGADDPVFAFNRAIIDATLDLAPVYKPNLAFYEQLGLAGWTSLKKTVEYVAGRAIVIGDAKRGDIDSTAAAYARALFEVFGFDAGTVNAYQGADAVAPFLAYRDRGVFVLCRSSNRSAAELQDCRVGDQTVFERIASLAVAWNGAGNCGLVAGATYPAELGRVRALAPGLPLLIPGVGAQGGDAAAAARAAGGGPFVISSSRGIMYAGDGPDFAEAARRAATRLRDEIAAA